MQVYLDARSIALVAGIVTLSIGLAMMHVSSQRRTYPGFHKWTAASLANAMGFVLLSLRGYLPDLVTVVVANLLLAGSGILVCAGLERFVDRTRPWQQDALVLGGLAALLAYLTFVHSSVNLRIVVESSIFVGYIARSTWLVVVLVPRVMGGRHLFLAAALMLPGAWFGVRAVLTGFVLEPTNDLFAPDLYQSLSFLVIVPASLFLMVGLISLNHNRLERELQTTEQEVDRLKDLIPICSFCKSVRDDAGYWQAVETYLHEHAVMEFTHGICPECVKQHYPEVYETLHPADAAGEA